MTSIWRAGILIAAILSSQVGGAATRRMDGTAATRAASLADHERQCAGKEGWSDAAPPLHIFGNVYDVGTCNIVVLLITGPAGHILIDAATAEAVPSIIANIERLGFRASEVKVLLSSHEHHDHVGGLFEMQRLTGAALMATAAARATLERGILSADDPQKDSLPAFAPVRVSQVVRDGGVVRMGAMRLTAHATPGHSPGSTTWSWRSCEGKICRSVVYADSVSAISAQNFRFSDHPAYVATLRASIAKIARLPCDLIITPHPGASDLYDRLEGTKPLRSSAQCRAYAAAARAKLDQRLASEVAAVKPSGSGRN